MSAKGATADLLEFVVKTPESCRKLSLMPIPLRTLQGSDRLCVDLYLRPSENAAPVLYRGRKFAVEPEDFERLLAAGVVTAYIPAWQAGDFQQFLRDNLQECLANGDLSAARRYEFLNQVARDELDKAFRNPSTDAVVEKVNELSDMMVRVVGEEDIAARDVFRVLQHDYHTFTHSFNVATYCTLLAKALGMSSAVELKQIAIGGLLHDLGKLQVPLAILNKNGKLTKVERRVIELHPTYGFQRISARDDLSWGQMMMIYQHHERLDGKGYPVGLSATEIHPYAKLCSVVDVFEAMTSNRPYRAPLPASEALAYLQQNASQAFDPDIVRCWVEIASARRHE